MKDLTCEKDTIDILLKALENHCLLSDSADISLLNYIKLLQQENEKLKLNHKQLSDIEKMAISNSKLIQENKEQKARIDKAIEKLTLLIVIGFDYDGFNKIESLKSLIDELVCYAIESRKILKGE